MCDYQRRRWKDRKIKAIELKGGCCQKCGYDRNYAALEFHHADPDEKEFIWKELVKKPWGDIIREIKKCILLCGNCHSEHHYPEFDKDKINNENLHARSQDKAVKLKKLKETGRCPVCEDCCFGTKYCSTECRAIAQRKIERPSRYQLKDDLKHNTYVNVAKKYGVSDNTVRKWAKKYKII